MVVAYSHVEVHRTLVCSVFDTAFLTNYEYRIILLSLSTTNTGLFTLLTIKNNSFFFRLTFIVMMMFAPNSVVRQKEGVQGEDEEEAGIQQELRRQARMLP